MKEYTHIYTLQVTDIIKAESNDQALEQLLLSDEYRAALERQEKEDFEADDVKVLESKIFLRE